MISHRSWIWLLFLTPLSWGQAPKPTTRPAPPKLASPSSATTPKASAAGSITPETAVITIPGLCDKPAPANSKSAECKTVVTRAEFERLVDTVAPNLAVPARKQLATQYGMALVMVHKAHQMGLDQGPRFQELMRVARIGVLTKELNQNMQDEAGHVSDKDIEAYYRSNQPAFQEIDLQRVFVPRTKQSAENAANKDRPATDDARKSQQESEDAMKKVADSLRARAAAGEDFDKLQEEAASAAEFKGKPPTKLGKVRRSSLPAAQAEVLELKPGETSQLIASPNGYLIYKVGEKDTLPLDKVHDEIVSTLRAQRIQEALQAIQKSATPELNDKYFAELPDAPSPAKPAADEPPSSPAKSPDAGPK
ncbi:MAG: peptidylprolyl isomerase [Terriglobales bacterium]